MRRCSTTYREKDGLEVDDGAASLRRLARRLEDSDHGKPSALAVMVPSGYGHARPGEVGVIPIGALGP